jgi:hypothetical protein
MHNKYATQSLLFLDMTATMEGKEYALSGQQSRL